METIVEESPPTTKGSIKPNSLIFPHLPQTSTPPVLKNTLYFFFFIYFYFYFFKKKIEI